MKLFVGKRLISLSLGLLFLSPTLLSNGSGDELGLGLYLAFIGVPIGLLLLMLAVAPGLADCPGHGSIYPDH